MKNGGQVSLIMPATRLAAVALATAIVATGVTAASSSPVLAGTSTEFDLLNKVNASRTAAGAAPVRLSKDASDLVSRPWSTRMASEGRLYHNPSYVSQISASVTSSWSRLTENVGYASSLDSVYQAFMNSSGHRANILDNRVNWVGLGVVTKNGRLWVTMNFIATSKSLTQDVQVVTPPPRSNCSEPDTSSWAGDASDAVDLSYTPVVPTRLLDSRSGLGVGGKSCLLSAGGTLKVQVSGKAGVPSSAQAAVVNVTLVNPTAGTFLSAFPAGTAYPGTSSVNALKGSTAAAQVIVPLGADGALAIRNGPNKTDVVIDLVGYFAPGTGGAFLPTAPTRQFDSRTTTGLAAGAVREVPLTGVPAGATVAVVNLTATGAANPGYLTAWSGSGSKPTSSALNYPSTHAISNRAFVPLSPTNSISVFSHASVDLVVDVVGWLSDTDGALFTALSPVRSVDTRSGLGVASAITSEEATTGNWASLVPSDATAIAATVTIVSPSRANWLATWPASDSYPGTSDINYRTGDVRANLSVTGFDPTSGLALRTGSGTSHAVVDVLGYFR